MLLIALCSCATAPREMRLSGRVACRSTLKTLTDPDPAIHALLQRYNCPTEQFPWRLRPLDANEDFTTYHLTYPSPRQYDLPEANTVHAEYYLPRQLRGRAPAVVVLDILDGSFRVSRLVCRSFAAAGIPSLMLVMPYYGDRRPPGTTLSQTFVGRPERMLQAIEGTVLDARRAACWLQARREVDPTRVGIVGTSLGGIIGALAVGVDPRFTRNVLILAGGDPVGILWHAPETRRVRDRMVELGLTLDSLRKDSRGIDPVAFAHRACREQILMINAATDETVPRESTVALWEAFGKPAIQWYPAGHYSLALFIPAILPTAAQFVLSTPPVRD
ncbi:MAG TPA: alpha/beta hydrolase family protein [Planctomycetota bacterium]|nr:alpha/beta hydrolase family protein [Planctomycetota bacterium]